MEKNCTSKACAACSKNVKKKLMPKGAIQSRADFGTGGYGGLCPPPGDKPHHYRITVFAVDVDKLPMRRMIPRFAGPLCGYHQDRHRVTVCLRFEAICRSLLIRCVNSLGLNGKSPQQSRGLFLVNEFCNPWVTLPL